jgi:copper chaperone
MITLSIPDMTCAHCKERVTTVLSTVPGAQEITVDLAARRALVDGTAAVPALLSALDQIGYPATVAG